MPHHTTKLQENFSREGFSQASQIAVGLMIITLFVLAGYIGNPNENTVSSAVSSEMETGPNLISTHNGEGQSQITMGTDFTKPDYQFIKRLKGM